jgi:hypothetical protein
MSARQRKLRMEQMEGREMMAVTDFGAINQAAIGQLEVVSDVTAYVQDGNLYVNESSSALNSDNGVRIARLDNGMVRVTGDFANNNSNVTSRINGLAFKDFSLGASAQLFVNLKGGNDRLHLGFDGGAGSPTFAAMNINMAAPEQLIASRTTGPVSPSIVNVPDADQVFMWTGLSRNTVNIATGAGNDWVFVGKATIGDGLGVDNLVINTGAGADQVTLMGATVRGNLDIQTYSSLSETDADVVYFDAAVGTTPTFVSGNINVRTGGGNDMVFSTDPGDADYSVFWLGVQSLGSMSLDTGAGDDLAGLRNMRVGGNFVMFAGAGADTLDMRLTVLDPSFGSASFVSGDLYVQMYATTEADVDTALFNNISVGKSMGVHMGGGNDVLEVVWAAALDNIFLDAGAGNDVVELEEVLAVDNFFALLGEGDDTLNVFNLYQPVGIARIDGGAGYDRLNKSGKYPAVREQTGWEVINGIHQGLNAPAKASAKVATLAW